jgi:hypothetical protein
MPCNAKEYPVTVTLVTIGGLVVSVLAIGPKVRGLTPGRERWISKGDKNQKHDFLRSKPEGSHVVTFYGMLNNPKRVKEILRRQNSPAISLPSFSCFATRCLY